jgi:hypothetical protein
MPVLDAKALETDPEGMAFLRAVLGPAAEKKQSSAPVSDACAEPRRALQVATPSASDLPPTPPTLEAAAAASAAA